jgi:site-specific recombinase XerD
MSALRCSNEKTLSAPGAFVVGCVDSHVAGDCPGSGNKEMNMDHWQKGFGDYLTNAGRGKLTIEAYLRDLDLYARWFEQINKRAFEPGFLCAPDLREYSVYLHHQEQIKPATWNRKRASLKVFTVWCQANHYVAGDPMQGVEPDGIQELAPFWLTPEDFRKLRRQLDIEVNTARSEAWRRQAVRNRAIAALIMYCGVRPGEVVNLNVSDLLLRERSGIVQIRAGKGNKFAEQQVGAEARQALSAWLELHPSDGALFTGKGSERLSVRQVERALNAIAAKAGLTEFHAHRLRHTYGRRLHEQGVPEHMLQDLMRHKNFRTTKRYVQYGREDLAFAVENL